MVSPVLRTIISTSNVAKGLVVVEQDGVTNVSGGFKVLDENERTFSCWGSVEVADKDTEIIPIANIKKDHDVLMRRGGDGAPLMYSHSNKRVGVISRHEFTTFTLDDGREVPAVKVFGRVYKDYRIDDIAWAEMKSGDIKGMSIGGVVWERATQCDDQGNCATVHKDNEFVEWSLAKNPRNPLALMISVGKDAPAREEAITFYKENGLQPDVCAGCADVYYEFIARGHPPDIAKDLAETVMDMAVEAVGLDGQKNEVDNMPDDIVPDKDTKVTPTPDDTKKGDEPKNLVEEMRQVIKDEIAAAKVTPPVEAPEPAPVSKDLKLDDETFSRLVEEVKKGVVAELKDSLADVYKAEVKELLHDKGVTVSETPVPAGGPEDTIKGSMEEVGNVGEEGKNKSRVPTPAEMLEPGNEWMPEI